MVWDCLTGYRKDIIMSLTIRNILALLDSSTIKDQRGQLWLKKNWDCGYHSPTQSFFGWDGWPLQEAVLKVGDFTIFVEDGEIVFVIKYDDNNHVDDVLVF